MEENRHQRSEVRGRNKTGRAVPTSDIGHRTPGSSLTSGLRPHTSSRGFCLYAVAAGLSILVAGCMVGPDYVRPTAPVPKTYKETDVWKAAAPKDHEARGPWWEIFNDPELNALEEQVNISNQNVAAAEANFRQSRALAQAARSALFPAVTTGPAVTRSQRSGTLGQAATAGGVPITDYLLPLNASWELDMWGRIRRNVEASRAGAQASAGELESVRLSTQSQLALNYFLLRSLDAQKQLLSETIAAYEKSLELTKNRYTGGIASRADVLQAETQLKSTQAQAIDVGVQRTQFEHAIALLVGRPPFSFSLRFAPIAAAPPPVPVGLPSELLERRPDIAAAERRVAAANAQIGAAMAAYFPRVTLSGVAGFESTDLAKWLTWPSRFFSVGPELAGTLFEGGLRRAVTDQARANYDANVALYRQTVLEAFQEVEDNLAALGMLEEEARVQDEAVKAAVDGIAIVRNQYKAGTVTYLNIVVAQAIALANQRTAVNILARRMAASVSLVTALGGGWNVSALPTATQVTGSEATR